jgi:hypothetical protein
VEIQTSRRPAGLITLRHRARSPGLKALEAVLRDYLAAARTTGLFDTAPEVRKGDITAGL